MKRRELLQSALGLTGALAAERVARATSQAAAGDSRTGPWVFPKGFLFGAATAAYQIEGAVREDGRGASIWDRFAHVPGTVRDGSTGEVACDSYHRYRDDVALLRKMGLGSYRFSVAWPRIQPTGSGPANQKGLDYYRRLVDALLEANIRPLLTLYHWDIPLTLVDAGGWPSRDTAARFVEYVGIVARALSDHVKHWVIFNEPRACTTYGYLPQQKEPSGTDPLALLKASHVINIAQGEAFRTLKAIDGGNQVGSAFDLSPIFPASQSEADNAAAHRFHLFQNLWFLRPALSGQYPEGVLPENRLHELLGFRAGDQQLMRADLDFIGVNYYSRFFVEADPEAKGGIPGLNVRPVWGASDARERTDYGWEVYPRGLYEILHTLAKETGNRPLEITENGAAYNEVPDAQGRIRDSRRISFLRQHLLAVHRALSDGLPVRAYHCWSLLDNFEWLSGYTERFGLTYVDFTHEQERILKDSGHWYGRVATSKQIG